jgi:hypothetical protein
MVGRVRQRRQLEDAFLDAAEGRCQLFTVVGAPGIGKLRLVGEFLAGVDAHVVRGRCLSYGDGITYWPLAEALRQLDMRPADPEAAAAVSFVLGEVQAPASPAVVELASEIAEAGEVLLAASGSSSPSRRHAGRHRTHPLVPVRRAAAARRAGERARRAGDAAAARTRLRDRRARSDLAGVRRGSWPG